MEVVSYLKFSKNFASYLSAQRALSAEEEAVIAYTIEILTINLVNLVLTLMIGRLLGVLYGTAVCLAVVILFRHTAGGAHSQSPYRCAMLTIVTFPILALIAKEISLLDTLYTDGMIFIAIGIGVFAVSILAPVDNPAAPIISPVRRKKLKILSLGVVILISSIILFLRYSNWEGSSYFQQCLALGVLWSSFILSRSGHRFMYLIDKIHFKR